MTVRIIIFRIVACNAAALPIARLSILKALTVTLLAVRLYAFTFHFFFNLN
jgi:hypothetical protein